MRIKILGCLWGELGGDAERWERGGVVGWGEMGIIIERAVVVGCEGREVERIRMARICVLKAVMRGGYDI